MRKESEIDHASLDKRHYGEISKILKRYYGTTSVTLTRQQTEKSGRNRTSDVFVTGRTKI